MSDAQFHLGTPEHCNAPMKWGGTSYSWEGPPGGGASISVMRLACTRCEATLTCELREPDTGGAA